MDKRKKLYAAIEKFREADKLRKEAMQIIVDVEAASITTETAMAFGESELLNRAQQWRDVLQSPSHIAIPQRMPSR